MGHKYLRQGVCDYGTQVIKTGGFVIMGHKYSRQGGL